MTATVQLAIWQLFRHSPETKKRTCLITAHRFSFWMGKKHHDPFVVHDGGQTIIQVHGLNVQRHHEVATATTWGQYAEVSLGLQLPERAPSFISPPDYDYDGDGLITALDRDGAAYTLGHPGASWKNSQNLGLVFRGRRLPIASLFGVCARTLRLNIITTIARRYDN